MLIPCVPRSNAVQNKAPNTVQIQSFTLPKPHNTRYRDVSEKDFRYLSERGDFDSAFTTETLSESENTTMNCGVLGVSPRRVPSAVLHGVESARGRGRSALDCHTGRSARDCHTGRGPLRPSRTRSCYVEACTHRRRLPVQCRATVPRTRRSSSNTCTHCTRRRRLAHKHLYLRHHHIAVIVLHCQVEHYIPLLRWQRGLRDCPQVLNGAAHSAHNGARTYQRRISQSSA